MLYTESFTNYDENSIWNLEWRETEFGTHQSVWEQSLWLGSKRELHKMGCTYSWRNLSGIHWNIQRLQNSIHNHTCLNNVTISHTVTFDEEIVISHKFIDVTGTDQPSNTEAGCKVSPLSPSLECSTTDVNETINNEQQVHFEVATDEGTARRQDLHGEESSIRRSACQNKGIPAKCLSYVVHTARQHEPESWKEMQKLPVHEKRKWIEAADEEMNSLKDLQTWELIKLPAGKHTIGCSWSSKPSMTPKARHIVTRPDWLRMDIRRITAMTMMLRLLQKQSKIPRTLQAVAAAQKMQVQHADVKTTFLNGEIEEDLFMLQPEGYVRRRRMSCV